MTEGKHERSIRRTVLAFLIVGFAANSIAWGLLFLAQKRFELNMQSQWRTDTKVSAALEEEVKSLRRDLEAAQALLAAHQQWQARHTADLAGIKAKLER